MAGKSGVALSLATALQRSRLDVNNLYPKPNIYDHVYFLTANLSLHSLEWHA